MRMMVLAALFVVGWAQLGRGTDTLDIRVIDTDGGKAVLLLTPAGESVLIDAGYPREDERDTRRIVEAAQAAGLKRIDVLVATHYDRDHSGNVARVDQKLPARLFVDHGAPMPDGVGTEPLRSYVAAVGTRPRLAVRPGDVLPLKGAKVTVVAAGGAGLIDPLPGVGAANPLCVGAAPRGGETSENAGSVGLLVEFGRFRMLDLADLLAAGEWGLVCPVNRLGTVDMLMVSHHGFAVSNSAALVHAVRARVAIMNNGPRKGGEPAVFDVLRSAPGLEDLWQLHTALGAGDKNGAPRFIANVEEACEGRALHVLARRDGSFSVTNTRTGETKVYGAR